MRYILTILFLLLPGALHAKSSEESIVIRLERNGYELVERKRTWLGRIVLEFESSTEARQIIFNPRRGVIVRDYSEDLQSEARSGLLSPFSNRRDSDKDDDDDDDDDRDRNRDRDDDDDDRDKDSGDSGSDDDDDDNDDDDDDDGDDDAGDDD